MRPLAIRYAPLYLFATLLWLLFAAPIHAQEPDFSDTPDILNGKTHLLRNDDLVVFSVEQEVSAPPYTYGVNTNFLLTANSAVSQTVPSSQAQPMPAEVNTEAVGAAGRMFDLPTDITTVVAFTREVGQDGDTYLLQATFTDLLTNVNFTQPITSVATPDATRSITPTAIVMADFTGDGFDDLVLSYGGSEGGYTVILQAADVGNLNAGVVAGPTYAFAQAFASLAAADVDGNGQLELVGAVPASAGAAAAFVTLNVDPHTLAITQGSNTALAVGNTFVVVVSGDYDDNPADDEIVIASSLSITSPLAYVYLYDFIGSPPAPTLLDTMGLPASLVLSIVADSGPVHWFGADGDVIVVGVQSPLSISVFVLTVEQNAFVFQEEYEASPFILGGLKLGRFDNQNTDGTVDPDLQVALLGMAVPSFDPSVTIFDIGSSGSGYTLTAASNAATGLFLFPGKLAVGDLQGRSLRLGAPTKITINNHSEPSTMVGMPPMHLDWAIPSCNDPNFPKNCTTIQQVEVMAQPASNYAQLNTDVKGSSQSSSQKTTSFTLAAQETVDAKISYGIPDILEASLEVKDTAKEAYNSTVATAENSYSSFAFDASVRTGFADHIWFDNYRFNLWTYPIIGQMVCPQSTPNCTDAEKVPLHVQFSGPDQISTYEIDGNVVEWYQPVWEPGNILSYPWAEDQLLAMLPRSVINNKSDVWAADSSGSNASVAWAQGGGQSTSQGNTNSYSNDASVTASGEISIDSFTTVQGSSGVDITVSDSTQTLNTSSNTHGSSTGFTVAKSEQGVTDYLFAAQTYILGQVPPTGTLQTLPMTATVQTSGPLRLAYWVNPFDSVVGGDWWPATYTLPDVALNHPQRWTWTNTPQPNRMTFNHILTSTSVYDQDFYFMRGFYVTSVGGPNGSQLTTAPLTETVLLQARVYNYSHVDMNAPTLAHQAARVKVRFYGQRFRSDTGEYPVGESFLIGESELLPIPGFDSDTMPGDTPNWSLAVQPFNPASFAQTQNGDVYVRFWVVVWMEDAAGHLVAEMPGHGLSVSPTGREYADMSHVHVEPYSNNVGTFKQVFYVQGPNHSPLVLSSGAQGNGGAPSSSAAPTVTIEAALTVAPGATAFGKHQITTIIQNGSANTSLHLAYYDGDPAQGGRLFDWEMIPYLVAGAPFVNRVTYTPQACGAQQVYVIVNAAGAETTQSMQIAGAPCQMFFPWIEKR